MGQHFYVRPRECVLSIYEQKQNMRHPSIGCTFKRISSTNLKFLQTLFFLTLKRVLYFYHPTNNAHRPLVVQERSISGKGAQRAQYQ